MTQIDYIESTTMACYAKGSTVMRAWIVRGGLGGRHEAAALRSGMAFAGWDEVGDLSQACDREAIQAAVLGAYPEQNNNLIGNWTGQLERFVHEMGIGDVVVMPLKLNPGRVAIGRVASNYSFVAENPPGSKHCRQVEWLRRDISRESLSHDLRASLGSLLTICELKKDGYVSRLETLLETGIDPERRTFDGLSVASLDDLRDRTPISVSRREIMTMAGIQRRTVATVEQINAELLRRGLRASETLDEGGLDEEIMIVSVGDSAGAESVDRRSGDENARNSIRVDFKVSTLPSATIPPVDVSPGDSVRLARTIMLENDYSQLAVVDNGALIGAITWQSIALSSIDCPPEYVRQAIVPSPPVVWRGDNLLDVVDTILKTGYVFVRGEDEISGIVTVTDLAKDFGNDRRPLILIEEIELRLRRAMHDSFTDDDVRKSPAKATRRDDVTLGAYPYLLAEKDDWDGWARLKWNGVDRDRVIALTKTAANIRNSLMHFSPDRLEENSIDSLHGLLRILRSVDSDPVHLTE